MKEKHFNHLRYNYNKDIATNLLNEMNQTIIVFDTETTGLPQSKIINSETLHLWPHTVQFSYVMYNVGQMKMEKVKDVVVKIPENIVMSEETINLHKITNENAHKSSFTIQNVLNEFIEDISCNNVTAIVGHNILFDMNMLKIELLRLIQNDDIQDKSIYKKMFYEVNYTNKTYCTMKKSVDLCQIPAKRKDGTTYYKFPKLIELYKKLFDEEPINLHNSLNDVLVTLRCYYTLVFKEDLLKVDESTFKYLFETNVNNM
jgi:DNA polymerase III epsilon subunit-like protein